MATMNGFAATITGNVQVRRHNGQCGHGEWLAIDSDDVPDTVGDAIADRIAEHDEDAGVVQVGGAGWEWAKMLPAAGRKITISGNWRLGGPPNEWAGTGTVDRHGAVECSADLGDDAYDQIEEQIADGQTEGNVTVFADDGRKITYHWAID